jgi:dipeptidyl aminopeptidase/acylaminoacyl peptidase
VSRDGKYLAAPTESDLIKSLWVYEVTPEAPPPPLLTSVPSTGGHGFATLAPDNASLVAAWGGKLWQLDRVIGTEITDLALAGLKGTHPDWSPDGARLVFATGANDAPDNASLALIPRAETSGWGAPVVHVPSTDGATNLFPMFSPDGAWIAFSRGDKGGHDDPPMQLMLVGSETGSTPIPLTRANCTVSTRTDDCKTENYQPTWAPPGDLQWIAFNSRRAYGVVQAAGPTQLWIAAVDPTKIGQGDPSFPAFRVPFQGLKENNHRAYWTLDIRATEPLPDAGPTPDAGPESDARACIADDQTCDPSFDTCCGPNFLCDTYDDGLHYIRLHAGLE